MNKKDFWKRYHYIDKRFDTNCSICDKKITTYLEMEMINYIFEYYCEECFLNDKYLDLKEKFWNKYCLENIEPIPKCIICRKKAETYLEVRLMDDHCAYFCKEDFLKEELN